MSAKPTNSLKSSLVKVAQVASLRMSIVDNGQREGGDGEGGGFLLLVAPLLRHGEIIISPLFCKLTVTLWYAFNA